DFLDVADQISRGIGLQGCVRRALSAAALVEVDDAVLDRVKEAALFGLGATAGTAVQKYDRLAGGIAAFLEVDLVDGRDPQPARVIWLKQRIKPGDGIFHHGLRNAVVGHAEQYT